MQNINVFVEDQLTEAILLNIIKNISQKCSTMVIPCVKHGSGNLKKNINEYNRSARSIPVIVVTDLDTCECAPVKVHNWLPRERQNEHFLFFIIVREIEAWLLADTKNFAKWINCKENDIANPVDTIPAPKEFLVNLVRKSKRKQIIEQIVPQGNASQGPEYNDTLSAFVKERWSLDNAIEHSLNLRHFFCRMQDFCQRYC